MDRKYSTLEVSLKDGTSAIWDAGKGDWNDYTYDGKALIVKDKAGAWAGIYNFDCIRSVVVK